MGPSPGTSLGPGGPATATDGAAPQPERRCIAITAEEATLQPSGTAPATCHRNRHRKEARISPHGAGDRPGSQPEPVPARRISPRRRRPFGPQPATRMRHPSSPPALAGVFRNESRPNAPQTSQNQQPHAVRPTLPNPPPTPQRFPHVARTGKPPFARHRRIPHAAPLQPLRLPRDSASPAPWNHPAPPSTRTPPAAPPPRNSASPAPENRPAAGNLSAPAASTRRNTLPRDLFRSRKRALTFADKQSYV